MAVGLVGPESRKNARAFGLFVALTITTFVPSFVVTVKGAAVQEVFVAKMFVVNCSRIFV